MTGVLLAAASRPFPDWEWLGRNTDDIWSRFVEHAWLTAAAIAIGLLIAVPLALLTRRVRVLHQPALQVTGVLFTIPSLALFAFLVTVTGLSTTTALIPLVLYTLLILYRNVVLGLDGVPSDVVESAEAMGYRRQRRLWTIEVPLALPVIVAGIRVATVTTIGLVTVTALIGRGGLGQVFLEGFRRDNLTATAVGVLLSVAFAVVADLALLAVQRLLTPWARTRAA